MGHHQDGTKPGRYGLEGLLGGGDFAVAPDRFLTLAVDGTQEVVMDGHNLGKGGAKCVNLFD